MAKRSQIGTIGRLGEEISCQYLSDKGYKIIDTNVTYKFGEIDIVALKDSVYHFIEVKAADENSYMAITLSERLGIAKLQRIKKAISAYISSHNLYKYELQIDLLMVKLDQKKKTSRIKYLTGIT